MVSWQLVNEMRHDTLGRIEPLMLRAMWSLFLRVPSPGDKVACVGKNPLFETFRGRFVGYLDLLRCPTFEAANGFIDSDIGARGPMLQRYSMNSIVKRFYLKRFSIQTPKIK